MEIRCVCPPKADGTPRHDHDTVNLKDHLSFADGRAVRNALAINANTSGRVDFAEVLATLSERFVRYGIESWTIVDEKNKPVDVSQEAIERFIFSDYDVGSAVADEADGRYQDAVLRDLIQRASESLPSSSITASTSAGRSGTKTARSSSRSSTPRKPSSPSSITSIPTGVTETTSNSLDGDSSMSPRSTSAA